MLKLLGFIKTDLPRVRFFDIITVLSKSYMEKLELLPALWNGWYENKDKAVKAWNAGKDFKIRGGPYCSIRDKEILLKKYDSIYIEYNVGELVRVV